MKSLSIALLALITCLSLTGCASDKYYELGFEIGGSSELAENWAHFEKMNPIFGEGLKKSFDQICQEFFDSYTRESNSDSFALPTSKELESLIQGCRDGYRDATRP